MSWSLSCHENTTPIIQCHENTTPIVQYHYGCLSRKSRICFFLICAALITSFLVLAAFSFLVFDSRFEVVVVAGETHIWQQIICYKKKFILLYSLRRRALKWFLYNKASLSKHSSKTKTWPPVWLSDLMSTEETKDQPFTKSVRWSCRITSPSHHHSSITSATYIAVRYWSHRSNLLWLLQKMEFRGSMVN